MTQDEIIKMAEEAGLYYNKSAFVWTSPTAINLYPEGVHPTALEDFAKLVAQHEREACAKVCDSLEEQCEKLFVPDEKWPTPADCANIIRARGQA